MSSLHYLTLGNSFSVMQDSCNPDNWIMHLLMFHIAQVLLLYYTDPQLNNKKLGRKTLGNCLGIHNIFLVNTEQILI